MKKNTVKQIKGIALFFLFGGLLGMILFQNLISIDFLAQNPIQKQIHFNDSIVTPLAATTYSANTTISSNTNQTQDLTITGCTLTIENCIYNFSSSNILLSNFGTLILFNCTFLITNNIATWTINNGELFVNNSFVIPQPANYSFGFILQGFCTNISVYNSDMAYLLANNETTIVNSTIGNLRATSDTIYLNISSNSIVNTAYFYGQTNITIINLNITTACEAHSGNYTFINSTLPHFTNDDYANSTIINSQIDNLTLILGNIVFINCTCLASSMDTWGISNYYIQSCVFQNCTFNQSLKFTEAENSTFSFNGPSALIRFQYYNLTSDFNVRLIYRTIGSGSWKYMVDPFINTKSGSGTSWVMSTWGGYFSLPNSLAGTDLEFYLDVSDSKGNYGYTQTYQIHIQGVSQQQTDSSSTSTTTSSSSNATPTIPGYPFALTLLTTLFGLIFVSIKSKRKCNCYY
jgi:hypothetical protein